jgi:hypothetical protein
MHNNQHHNSIYFFKCFHYLSLALRGRISGITLLTSMIEVKRNKFQNFTFECHVDNKE